MKPIKVLVIEDEADIVEVIAYNLSREGYEVLSAGNGEEGLRKARHEQPDLIILDIMLPTVDGIEVCRKLKTDSRTLSIPIVMVTARGEESDIVLGLGVGADDYITKPFSQRELAARVKAVLRRGPLKDEGEESPEPIARDGLVVDTSRHEVTVDGDSVAMTATEFRLLHFLACHPGRVFTRNQLLDRAIGEDAYVLDRNIDVHIRAIRKKLGPYRDLIETVRGVGYRFHDA